MTKTEMLRIELDLMDRFTSKDFSGITSTEDFEYKLVEIYYEIYNELIKEETKKEVK